MISTAILGKPEGIPRREIILTENGLKTTITKKLYIKLYKTPHVYQNTVCITKYCYHKILLSHNTVITKYCITKYCLVRQSKVCTYQI